MDFLLCRTREARHSDLSSGPDCTERGGVWGDDLHSCARGGKLFGLSFRLGLWTYFLVMFVCNVGNSSTNLCIVLSG